MKNKGVVWKSLLVVLMVGVLFLIEPSLQSMWTGTGSHASLVNDYYEAGSIQTATITWTSELNQPIHLPGSKGIESIQLLGIPSNLDDKRSSINFKLCNEYNCINQGGSFDINDADSVDEKIDDCYDYDKIGDAYIPHFQNQFGWVPTCEEISTWDRVTFGSNFDYLPGSEDYTISGDVWRYTESSVGYDPIRIVVWYWVGDVVVKARVPDVGLVYRADGRVETDYSWDDVFSVGEICAGSDADLYDVVCSGGSEDNESEEPDDVVVVVSFWDGVKQVIFDFLRWLGFKV